MRGYTAAILADLKRQRREDLPPHHIEAFMRVEHDTLDGLSPEEFDADVAIAAEAVVFVGPLEAEKVAQSFGLRKESAPANEVRS